MARPRTHTFWIDQINECARNNPHLRAASIQRMLEQSAARGHIKPPAEAEKVPVERTIRRIVNEFRKKPEIEQRVYDWFRWPDSMEASGLPWEASRACLDLLRFMDFEKHQRPLVRTVQQFWRMTLAVPPGTSVEKRLEMVAKTELFEALGRSHDAIEFHLAYTPWRDVEAETNYELAIKNGHFPRIDQPITLGELAEGDNLDLVSQYAYVSPGHRETIDKLQKKKGGKHGRRSTRKTER